MLAGVEEPLLREMRGNPFPLESLPYGVFSTEGDPAPRIGVAIDDRILDLSAARLNGLSAEIQDACAEPDLNALMSLGRPAWLALRTRIQVFLQSSREHTVA